MSFIKNVFLSKIVEKLNKRSPLKYAVVRALQSLDPRFIALQRENAEAKLLDDKRLIRMTLYFCSSKDGYRIWMQAPKKHSKAMI